jgi:hypothetical protein
MFQNKKIIITLLLVSVIIISSNCVFAEQLTTTKNGTVSGGVDLTATHPWGPNYGEINYTLPINTTKIKYAGIYVNVYSGSGADGYRVNATIKFNGGNGYNLSWNEILEYPGLNTVNDPTRYYINDHVDKCYSDYFIYYDVTDKINGNSLGVQVSTERLGDYNFDGRIKLISLIVAYDDGDNDKIHYYINSGQDWMNSPSSTIFNTNPMSPNINEVNLYNIALSSSDGAYKLNDDNLIEGEHISGSYYQFHKWDIYWNAYENLVSGGNITLSYIPTGGLYGASFKSVLAMLIVKEGEPKGSYDLKVDSINYEKKNVYYKDNLIQVKIVVKNEGTIISDTVVLGVYVEDKFQAYQIDPLEAQEEIEIIFNWTPLNSGKLILHAVLNPNNVPLEDSDRSNNNLSEEFNISNKESTIITLTNNNILKGEIAVITATLKNSYQTIANQKIDLKINGITYSQNTNSQGIAIFNIHNLSEGTYNIEAKYHGNEYLDKSTANGTQIVSKIKTNLDLSVPTIYQGKSTVIVVTLKDFTGKALANEKITLNLNKKTYSANTNSKGIATFKITGLKKGKYQTKVTYNGNTNYLTSSSTKNQIVNGISDLVITKVKRIANRYYITIKNKGSLTSTKTSIKISYNKKSKIATIKAISPGKSLTVKVPFYSYNLHKKYKKIAQVNYNKKTKESNYNNNKKTFKL